MNEIERAAAHLLSYSVEALNDPANRLPLADMLHDLGRDDEARVAADLSRPVLAYDDALWDALEALRMKTDDPRARWAYRLHLERKGLNRAASVQEFLLNSPRPHRSMHPPSYIGWLVRGYGRREENGFVLDDGFRCAYLWCPDLAVYVYGPNPVVLGNPGSALRINTGAAGEPDYWSKFAESFPRQDACLEVVAVLSPWQTYPD